MWWQVFRVIGEAAAAFVAELFGDSKDFESSEFVSVVLTSHFTSYVTVLLIDLYNEGYINFEVSIVTSDWW